MDGSCDKSRNSDGNDFVSLSDIINTTSDCEQDIFDRTTGILLNDLQEFEFTEVPHAVLEMNLNGSEAKEALKEGSIVSAKDSQGFDFSESENAAEGSHLHNSETKEASEERVHTASDLQGLEFTQAPNAALEINLNNLNVSKAKEAMGGSIDYAKESENAAEGSHLHNSETKEALEEKVDTASGRTNKDPDKNVESIAVTGRNKNEESNSESSNCDGSEYVPSDEKSDSEGSESDEATEHPTFTVNASCESAELSLHASFNVPGNSACDEQEQIAEKSRGRKGGQKKNFCIYCKTQQSKIARHLENKHSTELAVQKFMSLPKNNAERKKYIAEVRKKGNFIFNVNQDWNGGKIIPVRRPTTDEKRMGQNFVPCAKCRGFYAKNNIRHHYRSCILSKNDISRNVLTRARQTVGRIHPCASLVLRRDVFPVMREDKITRIIRYDELIILYGNKQCKNLRLLHQHDEIRAHLRRLGRFLEAIRAIDNNITDMASVFDPKYYNATIDAVNVLAGLDPNTQRYKIPSNASAMGTALKKLGLILEAECIKKHDDVKKKHTKDFLKLLSEDYGCSINKGVTETLTHIKRTKKVNLPKTDDIKVLDSHLDEIISTNSERLAEDFDLDTWKNLASAVLIKLQLFNRRRAGELERISVEELENRQGIDENDEMYKKLSSQDKISAKKYVRIEIRGKLNRTVPVLMSTDILTVIKLLQKNRKSANVPSKNPYIFGVASSDPKRFKHLRACTLMRQFADECGAQDASSLRGTNLRKHIATRCVSLNLSEKQITRVANFMGHHENIHREIYRQPVAAVDILDMSKVLEKAQGLNETGDSVNNTTGNSTDQNATVGCAADESVIESTLGTSDDGHSQILSVSSSQPQIAIPSKKSARSSSGESFTETAEISTVAKRSTRKRQKVSCDVTPSPDTRTVSHRKKQHVSFETSPGVARSLLVTPTRSKHRTQTSGKPSKPESFPDPAAIYKRRAERHKKSSESSVESSPDASPQAESKFKVNASRAAKQRSSSPCSKMTRRRWTTEEKNQVFECFGSHIETDSLPSLQEIAKIKKEKNYLQDRTPEVVKTWIHNQLRNKKNGREVAAPKTVNKATARHIPFIFETHIADQKMPSLKECEVARKNDKKLNSLSAKEIRDYVAGIINKK